MHNIIYGPGYLFSARCSSVIRVTLIIVRFVRSFVRSFTHSPPPLCRGRLHGVRQGPTGGIGSRRIRRRAPVRAVQDLGGVERRRKIGGVEILLLRGGVESRDPRHLVKYRGLPFFSCREIANLTWSSLLHIYISHRWRSYGTTYNMALISGHDL